MFIFKGCKSCRRLSNKGIFKWVELFLNSIKKDQPPGVEEICGKMLDLQLTPPFHVVKIFAQTI